MIDFSAIDNNMVYEKVLWIVIPAVLLVLFITFAILRAVEDTIAHIEHTKIEKATSNVLNVY